MFQKIRVRDISFVVVGILLAYLYKCTMAKRSGYAPLVVEGDHPDIFASKYDISCVPGPQATAGTYTRNLTPGGYCDLDAKVRDAAGAYKIVGGIGMDLV